MGDKLDTFVDKALLIVVFTSLLGLLILIGIGVWQATHWSGTS